jgi:hypothetical protein
MKNTIYKLTIVLFIAGFLSSCEQDLEQLPFDEFATENAFKTAADFENGIRGVYLQLIAGGLYGGNMLSTPDVMSDNTTLSQYGRFTQRATHNFQNSANNTLRGTYQSAYSLIYRANQVLFYAEGFEGESKANIVAEAKALRALAHLNLVSFFGKIPTQSGDANSSLGVAYIFEADPNIEPTRITVQETYNFILEDLLDARSGINTSNPEGRMGKDAVNLLLSRVYLYMGQWQNAVDAANAVSSSLASRDDVVGIWEDLNKEGVLFYIPNEQPILGNNIGVTWSQGGVTSLIPEYVASFQLNSLYDIGNDIRRDAYIFDGSVNNSGQTVNFNGIKKLFARPGGQPGTVDYKILRAEEAMLNKAEAYFRLGNETAARQALDQIRTRRYLTPPSGETGSALLSAIMLERRLEFAFEYQRLFDLKRWGLPLQRGGAGDLADGTGTPSDVQNIPAGDNKFQLPLAQESLDANPNLVQNPGY